MLWIIALRLFLMACGGLSERSTVIAVLGTNGTAARSCINGSDYQYSLNELPAQLPSNTEVRLCAHHMPLETVVTISKASNITLVGYDSVDPIVKCLTNTSAGFSFTEIKNLTLKNFVIEECGFLLESVGEMKQRHTLAAVNLQECTDVAVANISIIEAAGIGLALKCAYGEVNIAQSRFERNGPPSGDVVGKGLHIDWSRACNMRVTKVMVDGCQFINNGARVSNETEEGADCGAGISINAADASNMKLVISDSVFVGNEVSRYGGGIFVSLSQTARNCQIVVQYSQFSHNGAKFGGAMYIEYTSDEEPFLTNFINNSLLLNSNLFEHNHAVMIGGAVSLFSVRSAHRYTEVQVVFENCTLLSNMAQFGGALAFLPDTWTPYAPGYLPEPVLKDCTIDRNGVTKYKLPYARNQYVRGGGAIYCIGHTLILEGENKLTHNKGSAVYFGFSSLILANYSITEFANNLARDGGAVYLLASVLYIGSETSMSFTGNRASNRGGAIYQVSPDVHSVYYTQACFISPLSRVAVTERHVVFTNNQAENELTSKSGHSIFTTSILPCCRQYQNCHNMSKYIFNDKVGNFSFLPKDRSGEIVTDINHAHFEDHKSSKPLTFIPGKERELPYTNLDDFNQTTCASFLVTMKHTRNSSVNFSPKYSVLPGNLLKLYGKSFETTDITLSSTSSREIVLSFEASMQPCPPGYIQNLDESVNLISCICSMGTSGEYGGIIGCNSSLMQAYRNPNYWVGYDDSKNESEDSLWTSPCPHNFCAPDKGILLPAVADRRLLHAVACSGNRMGKLCGKCEPGTTVNYHSLSMSCTPSKLCHLGWLFYILSELVPVTIIFLVILIFNIPFTSGVTNSFIFFSQVSMVPRFKAEGFPAIVHTITRISRLVYLFFNLDMFVLDELSYCLWASANALDIVSFSYVTMTYSFLLIVLVIMVKNKYNCNCTHVANARSEKSPTLQGNVIHGLSSFLVLFSSHCVKTSIMVLTTSHVYDKGSKNRQVVVYFNGEIDWMSGKHLTYVIPAVAMLTSFLIPSTLLLLYPAHYKLLSALRIAESSCTRKVFGPLERLKPFFDSFQGCFKDHLRFFSGLYFAYRYIFLMIVTWMLANDAYFLLSLLLCFILILHSILQPYRKRLHNTIDILLLGNLTLINLISAYNVTKADTTGSVSSITSTITLWVQMVLVHIPLACVLLYLGKMACEALWRRVCRDDKLESQQDDVCSSVIERLDYGTF